MIITLSGVQGSGKTTLLKRLSEIGYNTFEGRLSRSVLEEWDTTLQEIYKCPDKMVEFQETLFHKKITFEQDKISTSKIWITDRSYVDLLGYTIMVMGYKEKYNKWLDDYSAKCIAKENEYLCRIYVPSFTTTGIEPDGVRNTGITYAESIDSVMKRMHSKIPDTFITLTNQMIEYRVYEIKNIIDNL